MVGGWRRYLRSSYLLITGTPFGYLHRLLNYGMVAAKNTTTRSRIRWSADSNTLYFDGRALKLSDWKRFVKELLESAEELLCKELLFHKEVEMKEVDMTVIDDPSNHEAGHYFALDEKDAWSTARHMLLSSLRDSGKWESMIEMEGDGLSFLKGGVDEYENRDNKFRELLAILMMISCGLSGRGTEMTSLRYINTMDGDRGIYIEGGQMMFVTEYHKSMALMDDVKVLDSDRGNLTLDHSKVSVVSYQSIAWGLSQRRDPISFLDQSQYSTSWISVWG